MIGSSNADSNGVLTTFSTNTASQPVAGGVVLDFSLFGISNQSQARDYVWDVYIADVRDITLVAPVRIAFPGSVTMCDGLMINPWEWTTAYFNRFRFYLQSNGIMTKGTNGRGSMSELPGSSLCIMAITRQNKFN